MPRRVRPPPRATELVLVVVLVAGGACLRWHHLGTPSLWWDELVHLRTAEQPTVGDVWRMARIGLAPGAGNAGAVPLDYLALHAWLAATPKPAPENVERHYRAPACAFAILALPLAWLVGRRAGGPVVGVATLALLATSLPHVLYAVDARFYALYVLTTLASLAAFLAVVDAPTRASTLALATTNVAFVLAALYGIFPIAVEYLVLVVAAWLRRATEGRRLFLAAAAGGTTALGVLALYLSATAVSTIYPRGDTDVHGPISGLVETLRFFGGGSAVLAWTLAASLVVAPFVARTAGARALTAVALLSACAIPAIVTIAHWKHYYYHPRHALFLLPMVHVTTGLVLAAVLDRAVRRPAPAMALAVTLVVVVALPALRAYVADPIPFFQQTKTLRDFRGLVQTVAARTAGLRPEERYLLVLERRRPGHLANPVVAFYLDVYGLTDRVMLVGTGDPGTTLARLPAACTNRCRGSFEFALYGALGVGDAYDQSALARRFLGLRLFPWSRDVGGAGVVTWAPNVPVTTPPGTVRTSMDGLALFEPAP
jgi:hypothetical protein